METFNVYRFKNKYGEIIYVGKTKNGMNTRMRQHFSQDGHLPQTCYKGVYLIEYIEINSQIDMDIKELYYINKWKPKYNIVSKYESDNSNISFEDDKWLIYRLKEPKAHYSKWIKRINKEPQQYQEIIAYTDIGVVTGQYYSTELSYGGCMLKSFEYWMPFPKAPTLD